MTDHQNNRDVAGGASPSIAPASTPIFYMERDREVSLEVEIGIDEDPKPHLTKWISGLRVCCSHHADEILIRDEEGTRLEDLGLTLDGRRIWPSFRSMLDAVPKPPPTNPRCKHAYRFIARYRDCGQCRLHKAGVPILFQKCAFENFVADTEELRRNLARCREYADALRGFLFMLGTVGSGKTHLATAILREQRGDGSKFRYFRHLDLVLRLRASYHHQTRNSVYDAESDIRTLCRKAKLLVIDEIGVAGNGNDADVLLYDLLDFRYSHLLPTILVSNLNVKGLKEFVGERPADRFCEAAFAILNFNAPSRRTDLNADYLSRCSMRNK